MVACGDGSKGDSVTPLTSSMLDMAMGEGGRKVSDMSPEDLATLREFNSRNHVEAPTLEDMPNGTVIPVPSPEEGAALQDLLVPPGYAALVEKAVADYDGIVDGGGIKNSMFTDYVAKPPMELVPQALTRACARAMGYGAAKYAPNNWRRGMRWGEVFGALKRHLDAWNEGEDIDAKEDGGSGLNHLDHAAACLSFLCHMVGDERYMKMDDRP